MKTLHELNTAWLNNEKLVWNDPDPIEGNDYTITFMEEILENAEDIDNDSSIPILIQYNNGGSEAQVFLHEIIIK